LNKSPAGPIPWLGIAWIQNLQDNTAKIKYTNIISGSSDNGGFICYGTTKDSTYNTFYTIFNKAQNNQTDIQWHRTTKAGQVRDPAHFNDSAWRCWDNSLTDRACP
jgi:hypothetical protein